MKLDFLRAFVRPYMQYLVGTTTVALATYYAVKFGDADLAKYVVTGVIGAGLLLIGEYVGERASKRKEDK